MTSLTSSPSSLKKLSVGVEGKGMVSSKTFSVLGGVGYRAQKCKAFLNFKLK